MKPSSSPSIRALSSVALAASLALSAAGGLAACAGDGTGEDDDGASTAGRRVSLATTVTPAALSFTNDEGWQIEVRRAVVSIGALHYFSGEPIEGAEEARLERRPRPTERPILQRLVDGLGVREAHAHPGHYAEGEARGEMLEATTVDLTAGPTSLATGDGITGLVRSARFTWGTTPAGPLASELGGAVVVVEGRATRDEQVRIFRLRATAADLPDGDVAIDGCVFDRAEIEGDGAVTLTIDPAVWLAGADFEDADEGTDDAPADVPAGTQPSNAFLRGLAKGGAFRFHFEPN